MTMTHNDPLVIADVRNFVMHERRHCVSDREWQHRLRGYGYGIEQTARGRVLTSLPQGVEICGLDA